MLLVTLFDVHERPALDEPLLIVSLEGWIDAGLGAEAARDTLLTELDTTLVADFDTDALLDYRARRPVLELSDGVNMGLRWQTIELHATQDLDGKDLLLLVGVEPDHAWKSFAAQVTELAVSFGTRLMCGLGAYPATVPHTRPTLLSVTATSPDLAAATGLVRGSLDVPAGIEAVLERSLLEAGIPAAGLWAQVPHYISAMRYPSASLALLETLERVGGVRLPKADLVDEAVQTRERIDGWIADNSEHLQMIRELEEHADQFRIQGGERLPSGDELAAELQRFLREQGGT